MNGFTLVELLVVIAIIGILSALLLPALGRGKALAKSTACLSQLRQLGLASQLYRDDHGGQLFPYRFGTENGGVRYWFGWIGNGAEGQRQFDASKAVLHPYLKGRGVEMCPSFRFGSPAYKAKARGATYGYGYNLHLSPPLAKPGLRITQLMNPSSVAEFADAAQVNTFQAPASPENPMIEEFYYINATEKTTHFRHLEKANAVFLDGHAGSEMGNGQWDNRLPEERIGVLSEELLIPVK